MEERETLILIDDDPDVRSLFTVMMENRGYDIIALEDGKSGLETINECNQQKIRAIFLDLLMPELNGLDVLVRLKTEPDTQNIPVIILTTEGMMDDMINGYQMGADYYIPKPFTQEQLLYGLSSVS